MRMNLIKALLVDLGPLLNTQPRVAHLQALNRVTDWD